MNVPKHIQRVIDALSTLPSVGPRQATRLVFHLINQGKQGVRELAERIRDLERIKICGRCFFIHEEAGVLCSICRDPKRSRTVIALVEKETDLLSLERTKKFAGTYLILGPIAKTGLLHEWQKLRVANLKHTIAKEAGGKAEEIILALNPTASGEFYASMLAKELAPFAKKLTRLGRGIPTGGEIEFADEETLGSALVERR
ncbi:MAG: recombination protein RecR [Candidatus Liptonbacteria bacterium]|nr:recombination protein RecR [Candidatus Liptonbacteria bacterium]